MIRAAHRRGLEVHVWTINDPDQMRRLWQMGVDGIVTDRTDLAVEVRAGLSPAS
jgi:glycerophosphoryl diester phosphodiesterase